MTQRGKNKGACSAPGLYATVPLFPSCFWGLFLVAARAVADLGDVQPATLRQHDAVEPDVPGRHQRLTRSGEFPLTVTQTSHTAPALHDRFTGVSKS
jgi:hypothetical protein